MLRTVKPSLALHVPFMHLNSTFQTASGISLGAAKCLLSFSVFFVLSVVKLQQQVDERNYCKSCTLSMKLYFFLCQIWQPICVNLQQMIRHNGVLCNSSILYMGSKRVKKKYYVPSDAIENLQNNWIEKHGENVRRKMFLLMCEKYFGRVLFVWSKWKRVPHCKEWLWWEKRDREFKGVHGQDGTKPGNWQWHECMFGCCIHFSSWHIWTVLIVFAWVPLITQTGTQPILQK